MAECVALLRGINVGKAKRVAMAELRALLQGLGHTEVRTLLNSGNAVFRAPDDDDPEAIADAIEGAIESRLGMKVPVVVVTAAELREIAGANPLEGAEAEPSRFLVAFARRPEHLAPAAELTTRDWGLDAIAVVGRAAYLRCAAGVLDSEVSKAFARVTKDVATARNWATVGKLLAMLDAG